MIWFGSLTRRPPNEEIQSTWNNIALDDLDLIVCFISVYCNGNDHRGSVVVIYTLSIDEIGFSTCLQKILVNLIHSSIKLILNMYWDSLFHVCMNSHYIWTVIAETMNSHTGHFPTSFWFIKMNVMNDNDAAQQVSIVLLFMFLLAFNWFKLL